MWFQYSGFLMIFGFGSGGNQDYEVGRLRRAGGLEEQVVYCKGHTKLFVWQQGQHFIDISIITPKIFGLYNKMIWICILEFCIIIKFN